MSATNRLGGWFTFSQLMAITLLIATVSASAAVEPVDTKAGSAPGIDDAPLRVAKSLMQFEHFGTTSPAHLYSQFAEGNALRGTGVCTPDLPCTGTPEGEPDCTVMIGQPAPDDQFNSGCNATIPAFSPISCGETVCGEGYFLTDGGNLARDTDWWIFHVDVQSLMTWSVTSEFFQTIGILDRDDGQCPVTGFFNSIATGACTNGFVQECLAPGTYMLFAAPNFGANTGLTFSCSNYTGQLICEPPCILACCVGESCVETDSFDCVQSLTGINIGAGTDCSNPAICELGCANAAPILCNSQTFIDNTTNDTLRNPFFTCGAGDGHIGVEWFQFTATDGSAYINTCASNPALGGDSTIAIYSGACNEVDLTEIDCGEDEGCGDPNTPWLSEICVSGLTVGDAYFIQFSAWDAAKRGEYLLDVECPCPFVDPGVCCLPNGSCEVLLETTCSAFGGQFKGTEIPGFFDCNTPFVCAEPPDNDDCADAIALCPGAVAGTNIGSSTDGSATCDGSTGGSDVWYSYTPDSDGMATVQTCGGGTDYDSVLSVHKDGCPGTEGNEIACDRDDCGVSGGPSTVTFSVTAGVIYLIRASGWNGSSGVFDLTLSGPSCGSDVLVILFRNGLPETLLPGVPTTFSVEIVAGSETLESGTATLHYRYDPAAGFQTAPLTLVGGNRFEATLPSANCGDVAEFYISADGNLGTTVTNPIDAPTGVHSALVGTFTTIMADDFETDQGWVPVNIGGGGGGGAGGDWQRGVPVDDPGWAYDPATDSDGSGQCYLTNNHFGNTDVDNGAVQLISRTMDLSPRGVRINYDYFLRLTNNADGADMLLVEIDGNDGAGPWIEIARHDIDGWLLWHPHMITQADLDAASVTLTSTTKVRFTTNDEGVQNVNESALDAFSVRNLECVDPPPVITATSSVVTHGPAGDFAESMVSGTIRESRLSGVTSLTVAFDVPMDPATTTAANVSVAGINSGSYVGTVGTSLAGPDDVLTITFTPALSDVDCHAIDLSGMESAEGAALVDSTFKVVVLHGDIDQNGVVSTGDASTIKPNFGDPVDATNFRFDYNHDGVISTADASMMKPLFGNSAPGCP